MMSNDPTSIDSSPILKFPSQGHVPREQFAPQFQPQYRTTHSEEASYPRRRYTLAWEGNGSLRTDSRSPALREVV